MSTKKIDQQRLGVCLEMLLTDRAFEKRFEAAARLGYTHAEMWLVDGNYHGTPEALAGAADAAGVTLTNTVVGSPDGSVGGGLTDPTKRDAWLDRVRMTMEFNTAAGVPATIVCTGNVIEGLTADQMRGSVLEGLAKTVELADEYGINLILEPLNTHIDHAGYYLIDSDEAAALCREIGSPRLKVLYDCYHMQIMEGNLTAHFERNIDVIGHVHIASVPGRNEPQLGEVDYAWLLGRFSELGYDGVFGLEYLPTLAHEESLTQTAAYLTGGSERS